MHPLERMFTRLTNTGQKVVYSILFKKKNSKLLYTDIGRESDRSNIHREIG